MISSTYGCVKRQQSSTAVCSGNKRRKLGLAHSRCLCGGQWQCSRYSSSQAWEMTPLMGITHELTALTGSERSRKYEYTSIICHKPVQHHCCQAFDWCQGRYEVSWRFWIVGLMWVMGGDFDTVSSIEETTWYRGTSAREDERTQAQTNDVIISMEPHLSRYV
jgi:hypothetical protein